MIVRVVSAVIAYCETVDRRQEGTIEMDSSNLSCRHRPVGDDDADGVMGPHYRQRRRADC